MQYIKATQDDIYQMFDYILDATGTDNLTDAMTVARDNKDDLIDLLRDPRMGTGYDISWDVLTQLVNEFVSHQTPSPFGMEA